MSDDPRRTGVCVPHCYRKCQCSRWPDMVDRWGNPVNHSGGGVVPVIPDWWLAGGIAAADCIGAYRAIATPGSAWGPGPANLAASYINLANPGTYDLTLGVAPVWAAATGWTFDGATTYLITGIVAGGDAATGGWTLIVQYSGAVADKVLVGMHWAGVLDVGFRPMFGGGVIYQDNGSVIVAPALAAGNLAVSAGQGYRNGIANGANTVPLAGTCTFESYIGAGFDVPAGTLFLPSDATIQAVAFYQPAITAAQVLAVATAMAAL